MATFLAIADNFKIENEDFSCRTTAKLEMVVGKYLITKAEMFPVIQPVNPEKDMDKVAGAAEKSKSRLFGNQFYENGNYIYT